MVYRPEMINGWSFGDDNTWQALLWRHITEGKPVNHRAYRKDRFLQEVQKDGHIIKSLPERVSVIGISSLPPFHLEILAGLAYHIDIYMYLLNPCREYWFDIIPDSISERIARDKDLAIGRPQELYFEKGNSILAALGKLGRDYFAAIGSFDAEERELYDEPGGNSLLEMIQTDILNLADRGQDEDKTEIRPADNSIRVHSCHTPIREIEILHDNLLTMFENDENLCPGDILVMTPDIEQYAPYITSVFDRPQDSKKYIPFSIADRSPKSENKISQTFLSILKLAGGRYEVSNVMAILESESVRRKFDLGGNDLVLIDRWLSETRIRWGLDGADRRKHGFADYDENSWSFGLKRLLLGYALPEDGDALYEDCLPFGEIEGEQLQTLNKFLKFFNELTECLSELEKPQTLTGWHRHFNKIIENFFAISGGDDESAIRHLSECIGRLPEHQEVSDNPSPIPIEVIRYFLSNKLGADRSRFGFISGAVTFCATLSMRSIPFKIICLIGFSEADFPRENRTPGFSLMTQNPRRGDRSGRDDDKYIFLEAIMSAREKLYISYVGQSAGDNSSIPPSIVVSELLEYIDQDFSAKDGKPEDRIVTKHRLQAFAEDYFSDKGELLSYSRANFEACINDLNGKKSEFRFIDDVIAAPEEDSHQSISIKTLCLFFKNPARFFTRRRLGFSLAEKEKDYEDYEPFSLDGLDRYRLSESLLTGYLENENIESIYKSARARGLLPHGAPGRNEFEITADKVKLFAESIKPGAGTANLSPVAVNFFDGYIRVEDTIDNIFVDSHLIFRPAKLKASDLLTAWIYHLFYCAHRPEDYPSLSAYHGYDGNYRFGVIENSVEYVNQLLNLYYQGLCQPLPFFPELSKAYAATIKEGKPSDFALQHVNYLWQQAGKFSPEKDDPYNRQCFGSSPPFDGNFARLSKDIYLPILRNLKGDKR